jgi:hypothetical protein
VALLVAGCGAAAGEDRAYARAVASSLDHDWEDAAEAAFAHTQRTDPDDERYDRALMLLAEALERLELTYAASLYYLEVASAGRNAELLDQAVDGIRRIVEQHRHDGPTLVDGYAARSEIDLAVPDLVAFLSYQRGLGALRDELPEWAAQHFAEIPDDTPYRARADYARAVHLLAGGGLDDGEVLLADLAERDAAPETVRHDAEIALARVAMERGRWEDAIARYESIRELAAERPELLLEMAWAHYYRGDSRRALGLLLALDAPAFARLIAPERFLLEAFCLRRLCQFEPARIAAARLRHRHGEALEDLHAGVAPADSEPLRQAARRRGAARDAYRVAARLRRERAVVEDTSLGRALEAHLRGMYDDGVEEAERREEEALEIETARLAEELVEAEDGVRIILHELSVALLRGRHRPGGAIEVARTAVPAASEEVSYDFQGEFWTDELDDLVVVIEDRCLD